MKSVIFLALLFGCSLAANFTIYAGFDINGWSSLNFYPSVLTVNRGDSVTFVPFTKNLVITFSPEVLPLVSSPNQNGDWLILPTTYQSVGGNSISDSSKIYSSGLLEGTNWTVSFPSMGFFQFYNPFSLPSMSGVVLVIDSRIPITPIPAQTVDTLTRMSLAHIAKNVFPNLAVTKGTMDTIPSGRKLPDGTYEWTVRMIGDIWTSSSYQRFVPSTFTVAVGDSIIFANDDITTHTVSFNSSGVFMKEFFNDTTGHLVFNGIFAESHSLNARNYTGGFANSGFLMPLNARSQYLNSSLLPAGMPSNFSFTFGGSNDLLHEIITGNYSVGTGMRPQSSTITNNNVGAGAGSSVTNTNNNLGGTITNNNNNLGVGGTVTNNNNNLGGSSNANVNGVLQPNATLLPEINFWKIKFGAAGTYPYRCDLHFGAGMLGQIVVVQHRNLTLPAK